MTKKIFALLLAFAMLMGLAACSGNSDGGSAESTTSHIREVKTKVAAPEGPIGFGLAKFSNDRTYAYEVRFCQEMSEVYDLILSGGADIAALPVDLAAKAYAESGGAVQALAVNSLGMFHVAENGNSVRTLADLDGKTVYTSGKGTATEHFINFILEKNGAKPDLQFIDTWEKLVELAVGGNADLCILPEPYLTEVLARTNPQKSEEETTAEAAEEENKISFKRPIELNTEWEKAAGYKLAQSVIVARTDYITANPDVINEFIGFNEISVNYLTASLDASSIFMVENGFYERSDAANSAIVSSNTIFLEGAEMKESISKVLEFLFGADPSLIGGKIPDDAFFYGA